MLNNNNKGEKGEKEEREEIGITCKMHTSYKGKKGNT